MNVNKRFQKLQQWGKEKMGSDGRSGASDDFKALETEMNMRHSGMEKMHTSMHTYVKSLNKRGEGPGGEKSTPVSHLGTAMSRHGEDFEDGNKFGECLISLGQANERISRFQDTYATNATSTWLEALERSLAQMKEYQNARKKLEARRATHESCLAKMQKAKTGDFRAEEELRSSKIKYEESTDDVNRRMQDIVESEQDSTQQLYAFLEAELTYHDRCREVLMQAWKNWPAPVEPESVPRPPRSRGNTLSRISTNTTTIEEEDGDLAPPRPAFRGGQRTLSANSTPLYGTPVKEVSGFDFSTKPAFSRSSTTEQVPRATSRHGSFDPSSIRSAPPLRPMKQRSTSNAADVFGDHEDDYTSEAVTRSSSPATSVSQGNLSRNTSYSTLDSAPLAGAQKKKAPPPPPPSRGTKPPPPPPPMKRSALSSSTIPTM